jgi:BioD-like phosphotransacetylase family protein
LPINLERNKALQALFLISIAGQLALADYQNKDNRDFCLTALKTAIDSVLPVLPDDVFQAAVAARVAVIEALNAQLLDSVREREIYQAMPATVLAHRFEMDERIFNAVNHVRHPLFVSGVIYD